MDGMQQNRMDADHPGTIFLVCCLLATLVTMVFLQVTGFEFVNFDDPIYLTENKHIQQGLTPETIHWAFTTHLHGHYHPFTWLSHTADYQFFGLDPAGHHFSSFLLHLVNTLLLFLVFRKMTGATWTSGFAAALFAVHPLHVESVAWVAGRKDLLCGFFWILSLWVYTKVVERPSFWSLVLLILVYFMGLLSKTMMITLPLILLLLDFWPLQRFSAMGRISDRSELATTAFTRLILEKMGLLLIAGLFVFISTAAMQDLHIESKTLSPYWQYDFLLFFRHYLGKFFWPTDLTVLYPYDETPEAALLIGAALIVGCITLSAFFLRKRCPFLLMGWLWFVITLLPVLGLIHDGPHRVADRYTYIPLIGLIIALSWSGAALSHRSKWWRVSMALAACTAVAVLSFLSHCQAGRWRSSSTLFTHAVAIYPNNWIAHNNLGDALDRTGSKNEAIEHYLIALQLNPDYAEANYNLGNSLASLGRRDEALHYFLMALQLYPDYAEAHNNRGVLLAQDRRYLEAKKHFAKALAVKPEYEDAKKNMRDLSGLIRELEERIALLQNQVERSPNDAGLLNNLGLLYREGGDVEQAKSHFLEALRSNPASAAAHNNLGILFAERGEYNQAVIHFQQAVDLDPDFPGAGINLERIKSLIKRKKQ